MAESIIYELRKRLTGSESVSASAFQILRKLTLLINTNDPLYSKQVQELLLLVLERQDEFHLVHNLLQELIKQRGLYPYLEEESLSFVSKIVYELHRPINLEGIVFHREQAYAYRLLLDSKSVILSAPTSFGKSLVIDAVIASNNFSNIVVVVPTIALIDETRRRLHNRFSGEYRIITHPSQKNGQKNVFVLTQERVVEFPDLDKLVDFFVVDEFYKLDPGKESDNDNDRSSLLNQAFERLYSPRTPFYLIGPNIEGVSPLFIERFHCEFIKQNDYVTVVAERKYFSKRGRREYLVELCRALKQASESTLIYCSSPAQTREVAKILIEAGLGEASEELIDASDWVGNAYHPNWSFTSALKQGIGLHHGKIPRSLAQFVVRAFDKKQIAFLVCTSTLIEGVNTKAKNVILYDDRLAQRTLDYFTFNNIAGRAGRMFQHFIGRVFIFGEPPKQELPLVNIPLVSQSSSLPASLIVQLKDENLTIESLDRVRKYKEQTTLPYAVIRENRGIDPEAQLRLAEMLLNNSEKYHALLSWTDEPSYESLETVCDLIWKFLWRRGRRNGVVSSRHLTYRINMLRSWRRIDLFIKKTVDNPRRQTTVDESVDEALDFLRTWVEFNFPRYLMAVSRIQAAIFKRLDLSTGDYSQFSSKIEHLFAPAGVFALDEYGIPLQVGLKLIVYLRRAEDLDSNLQDIKELDLDQIQLTQFERSVIEDARQFF